MRVYTELEVLPRCWCSAVVVRVGSLFLRLFFFDSDPVVNSESQVPARATGILLVDVLLAGVSALQ